MRVWSSRRGAKMSSDLISQILSKRSNIKREGLQVTLSRVKKRLDLRTIEQAACFYIKQHDLNINVSSIIDDVTRKAVQDRLLPGDEEALRSESKGHKPKKRRIPKPEEAFTDSFVDSNVIGAAYSNVELYPVVYVFENSVRRFVATVMEKSFGNNWWADKVNPKIQQGVEVRRLAEKQTPWHSKRGADPIYYTDIEDLLKIINTYSADFRKVLLGNFEHVVVWIQEIEKTRNILAHNNPVAKKDRDRLMLFAHDWSECAKALVGKL
jgi:Swt1-like HEPN